MQKLTFWVVMLLGISHLRGQDESNPPGAEQPPASSSTNQNQDITVPMLRERINELSKALIATRGKTDRHKMRQEEAQRDAQELDTKYRSLLDRYRGRVSGAVPEKSKNRDPGTPATTPLADATSEPPGSSPTQSASSPPQGTRTNKSPKPPNTRSPYDDYLLGRDHYNLAASVSLDSDASYEKALEAFQKIDGPKQLDEADSQNLSLMKAISFRKLKRYQEAAAEYQNLYDRLKSGDSMRDSILWFCQHSQWLAKNAGQRTATRTQPDP